MKGVESNLNSTQRSLRDVNKLLKLDPSNTTLLAQKHELLQQKIADTKTKLKTLKEADKQAKVQFEKGDLGKDKYDALQREIAETEQNLKALKKTAGSGNAALEKVSVITGKVGNKMRDAGKAIMPVSTAMAGLGAISVNTANDFESAMSQAAGALNKPMSQMEELREIAIQTRQDTIFSAKEAGQAITELAKGGLTEADIKTGALKATMDLAASSGMDLGNAANVVVQAMGAFGLSAEESALAANALAGAAAASSTDVEPLTQGLAQASAQAKNAGWSIQETTAVLGKFADAGIVGSDAGTSLKTMLQRLAAPTDDATAIIEELGIQTRDSSGELLGASDMAKELKEKLGGLSSAERDAALQTIFGSDAMRAATIMMNSGAEGLESYITATNDQESAQRLANSQMGEGQKAIEEMKGSLETAAITIGEKLAPVITQVVEFITELVNKFSELPSGVQTAILVIGALIAVAGPLLIIIGQLVISISAIAGVLSVAAVPIGAIIGIIAGVIAAITAVIAVIKNWGAISEWFKTLWETVCESVKEIVSTLKEKVTEKFDELSEKLSGIWESIKAIAKSAWEIIKNVVLGPVLLLCDLVTGDFENLKSDARNIWNNIKENASTIWNSVKDLVGNIVENLKEKAITAFKNLVSGIKDALSGLGGVVQRGFQSAIDFITSLPSQAIKWGKDFIQGLIDGIKSMIEKVKNTVSDVASTIRSFLHFSRPDVGPLRDYETWMPDFTQGLAKGIMDNIPVITRATRALANSMVVKPQNTNVTVNPIDYENLADVITSSSRNYEMVTYIDERSFRRGLRGMGVRFSG